ncbi:MAG: D-alanyl-D-alanine carboxypeptidase [Thermoclostridium sp.]|nr:D-alanyl-D-alanine carboxypeptidase [Thermoclostridium sp.]
MRKLFILSFIFFVLFLSISNADDVIEEAPASSVFEDYSLEAFNDEQLQINARSAIVMDFDSGRVLFEKNAFIKRPMASTTKVMTAIIALENCDLDEIVTVSRRAAMVQGSTINLSTGEILSMKELMYGLMMRSGNDASIAIAEHIGGSVEGFIQMMNDKAREIGAYNTQFTTPHGLDETGHYSTAYDMALITRYAMKNPTFNEIVKTQSIQVGKRLMYNTNEMLTSYAGADGVKTGYTGKAGRCLITSATRDGRRFISVVLFCDNRNLRALSSKKILDYTFDAYFLQTLIHSEYIGYVPVNKGFEKKVPVYVEKTITMPITESEKADLHTKISLPGTLYAPIKQKEIVGTMSVYLGDKILCESVIRAGKAIRQKNMLQYILDVFIVWFKMVKYE